MHINETEEEKYNPLDVSSLTNYRWLYRPWRSGFYCSPDSDNKVKMHYNAVESLWTEIRSLWLSNSLNDIISENSKVTAVDSRLPLHIVIRSLIEYRRQCVIIFSEELGIITGEFGVLNLADFLIHYWLCLTDSTYLCRLCAVISCFVTNCQSVAQKSTEADDENIGPVSQPETNYSDCQAQECFKNSHNRRQRRNRDSFKSTEQVFDNDARATEVTDEAKTTDQVDDYSYYELFSAVMLINNHKAVLSSFPPWFSVRLFECPSMTLKAFQTLYKVMMARKSFISNSEITGFSRLKQLVEIYEQHVHRDHKSCRTLFFPLAPPWIYSLEFWERLSGTQKLLSINPDRPTIEAAILLLDKKLPHLVLWNEERKCPLHFLTPYCLLNHIVQHLRGRHSALDLYIVRDLGLGVTGSEIYTITPQTPFYEVLQAFRDKQWRSIPVVHPETNAFLCFFCQSQLLVLIARILQKHNQVVGSLGQLYVQKACQRAMSPSPLPSNGSQGDRENRDGNAVLLMSTIDPTLELSESLETVMQRFLGFSFTVCHQPVHTYYNQAKSNVCFVPSKRLIASSLNSVNPNNKLSTLDNVVDDITDNDKNENKNNESKISNTENVSYLEKINNNHEINSNKKNKKCAYSTNANEHVIDDRNIQNSSSDNDTNDNNRYKANINLTNETYSSLLQTTLHQLDVGASERVGAQFYPTIKTSAECPEYKYDKLFQIKNSSEVKIKKLEESNVEPFGSTMMMSENSLAFLCQSHDISLQVISPAAVNATVYSPAIGDQDIPLRTAVSHILLTNEHRLLLIDPQTRNPKTLVAIGDLLAFLIGYQNVNGSAATCFCCAESRHGVT